MDDIPLMEGLAAFRFPKSTSLIASLLAALLLPGCATLGEGKHARLAEERATLLEQSEARATQLETKLAEAQRDNIRLSKRIADLESSIKNAQTQAANAAKNAEIASADSAVRAAAADQKAVAATGRPAAASPVQAAPRLVQPSFASQEKTIFENEAKSGDIRLTSVLYGVHLASYRRNADAAAGWRTLQGQYPNELSLLEPRIAPVKVEGRGEFIRLIAGGFSSQQTAAALCETLSKRGRFCEVTSFDGDKLSD